MQLRESGTSVRFSFPDPDKNAGESQSFIPASEEENAASVLTEVIVNNYILIYIKSTK